MNHSGAKKSLGQHFLTNRGVIDKISNQVEILCRHFKSSKVIEIGPGRGALTESLLEKNLNVCALEKDSSLEPVLQSAFSKNSNFSLHMGDVLDSENSLEVILKNTFKNESIIICGNLPYNIGTEIVFRFFENYPQILGFVFMLQKEVVKKFLSEGNDADFGTASLKMQLSSKIWGHFWVQAGSFAPPPKVDSGVFYFIRNPTPLFDCVATDRGGPYDKVSAFAHSVFLHRRKMLRAIVPALKDSPWAELRPQQLSAADFCKIALEWLPQRGTKK